MNRSSAPRIRPRADIVRLMAILLGPVLPFVVLMLDGVVAGPAPDNGGTMLAWAALVIGSMTAGPALGLVAAAWLLFSPKTPVLFRLFAFLCIPVNALMLLLVFHMHGR